MGKTRRAGDKFVIEIENVVWTPRGDRYFIKGFETLVFDDKGLARLEEYEDPPEDVPHTCAYCFYGDRKLGEMPCVLCTQNDVEPRDMFVRK